jgi:UPF0755 protein
VESLRVSDHLGHPYAHQHDDDAGLLTDVLFAPIQDPIAEPGRGPRRSDRHRSHNRRHGRIFAALAGLIVLIVVAAVLIIVPNLRNHFRHPDYSGSGSGTVSVIIGEQATAADIGATLYGNDVVKSAAAFVDAAKKDDNSRLIQPGVYNMHRHMSAKAALAMLVAAAKSSGTGNSALDTTKSRLVVTEGATEAVVRSSLIKALGEGATAKIDAALKDVPNAGLPLGYTPDGKPEDFPTSLEGFLYPATYNVLPTESPSDVIHDMTAAFFGHDKDASFALGAQNMKISPYQALIVASLVQSEAKYPEDMPKVARVIYNRIAAQRPLQIDAGSVYGAELNGVDSKTINYTTYDSPYNTYLHGGLPPTPISNPGADAMNAAIHPAKGSWVYYVNSDAAGHLFFTANENEFAAAKQTCATHGWGCAAN